MFKTETELQLKLFPRNWTETETEIMSGTEISLPKVALVSFQYVLFLDSGFSIFL